MQQTFGRAYTRELLSNNAVVENVNSLLSHPVDNSDDAIRVAFQKNETPVNVIIPLSGRYGTTKRFLDNFETNIVGATTPVTLTIVLSLSLIHI